MGTLRRTRKWLTGTLVGASQYLESVFIAVLLAPVLPEVAVDFFGGALPYWRNSVLRCAAVLVVLLACGVVYQWRRWLVRRRQAEAPMPEMGHYEVLVQPMSPKYTYRLPERRESDRSVPEVTVDAARPELLVAIVTPEVEREGKNQNQLREGLRASRVELEIVRISNAKDVKKVVNETINKVLATLQQRQVKPDRVCFDITGGTKPMSLAMLRAAALYGSDCCYVSSEVDRDGRLPHTQCARSFDPVTLFGTPG
jgi:hypothetical protein